MHMPVDSGLLQTLLRIKPLQSLALNVGSMSDATLESVILHDEPIRLSELYITLPSVTYIQNFISFLQKIQTDYLSIVALHIFLPLGVTRANASDIFLTISRFSLLSTLTIHLHAFPDDLYSDNAWLINEPPMSFLKELYHLEHLFLERIPVIVDDYFSEQASFFWPNLKSVVIMRLHIVASTVHMVNHWLCRCPSLQTIILPIVFESTLPDLDFTHDYDALPDDARRRSITLLDQPSNYPFDFVFAVAHLYPNVRFVGGHGCLSTALRLLQQKDITQTSVMEHSSNTIGSPNLLPLHLFKQSHLLLQPYAFEYHVFETVGSYVAEPEDDDADEDAIQIPARVRFRFQHTLAVPVEDESYAEVEGLVDVETLREQHVQDDDEDVPGEEVWVLSGYQLVCSF